MTTKWISLIFFQKKNQFCKFLRLLNIWRHESNTSSFRKLISEKFVIIIIIILDEGRKKKAYSNINMKWSCSCNQTSDIVIFFRFSKFFSLSFFSKKSLITIFFRKKKHYLKLTLIDHQQKQMNQNTIPMLLVIMHLFYV